MSASSRRSAVLLVLLAAAPWHALRVPSHPARRHLRIARPRLLRAAQPVSRDVSADGDDADDGDAVPLVPFKQPLEAAPWRGYGPPDWGTNYLNEGYYLEDISQPYWRRNLRVQYVTQWPVGSPEANPSWEGRGRIQFFRGLRDDLRRKAPLYASDWVDGLRSRKSIAAVSFLYFACLAPVVAFGGALGGLTQGAMGVSEVLLSCGLCGMGYATLSGQPMTFVAPTGLTLAFTAALYRYCARARRAPPRFPAPPRHACTDRTQARASGCRSCQCTRGWAAGRPCSWWRRRHSTRPA